jgi:hypothetical protein
MWNGSAWTSQQLPLPAGTRNGTSLLEAVSCPAANSCVAVGNYYSANGEAPLAEVWNGSTWKLTHPVILGVKPKPQLVMLNGVSCVSATDCVAVGNYNTRTGHVLIEGWNGSTWARQPAPAPAGMSSIHVTGVSCPAANNCTAVGYGTTTSTAVAFAERWNGSHWTLQIIPKPSGTGIVPGLSAVSCFAPATCTAVGVSTPKPAIHTTLAEQN